MFSRESLSILVGRKAVFRDRTKSLIMVIYFDLYFSSVRASITDAYLSGVNRRKKVFEF